MEVHATTDSRETADLTASQLWAEGRPAAVVELLVWNQLAEDAGRNALTVSDRYVVAVQA